MTPIQAAVMLPLLNGKDVVGQSKTGSGKTLAFGVPLLQRIQISSLFPQALVLCPTRELCDQVFKEFLKLSKYYHDFRAIALSGGQPAASQIEALKKGVHLVVGTPGRTLEFLNSGILDHRKLASLVLDEADRLLEEGFSEELTAILKFLPEPRQTIFFSATFPESIKELSQRYQTDAEFISAVATPVLGLLANDKVEISQFLYRAEKPEKIETLLRILQTYPSKRTLIFCRTKATVSEVGKVLSNAEASCEVLHGDLPQKQRDRAMSLFKNGNAKILVATDVAARGLHVETLELVINFDLPPTLDLYVHRIGRTGRAGKKGIAVSIATEYEAGFVAEIEATTGVKMQMGPEV